VVRFFRGVQLLGQAIVEPDVPLAELAETAGVLIPTNCTSGTCGTCMITLLKGDVPLPEELPPGLDEEMVEEQARLGCIGCPSGDVDIDVRPPL
jgi:ferredoxin